GRKLAQLDGAHALTDVTGFGLLGHLLELARGAKLRARVDMQAVAFLPQVVQLAEQGCVTGASGRNWQSYGHDVALAPSVSQLQQALLTDPQTAGGLLVSCAPDAVDAVLAVFREEGFADAAVIGEMRQGVAGIDVA